MDNAPDNNNARKNGTVTNARIMEPKKIISFRSVEETSLDNCEVLVGHVRGEKPNAPRAMALSKPADVASQRAN